MYKTILFTNIEKSVWIFLCVFCLFACKGEPASNVSGNYSVDNRSVKKYLIENDLAHCRFVKLGAASDQRSILTGDIERFFYEQNKYWVYQSAPQGGGDFDIKVFGAYGALEKIIPIKTGEASEFKGIADFWTDGKSIELLDPWGQNIWQTNYPSISFKPKKITASYDDFFRLTKNIYIFDYDNSPSKENGNNNLALVNIETNKRIDHGVPIKPFHKGIGLAEQRFSKDPSTKRIYYIPPVGSEVYEIQKDSIALSMQFDFAEGQFQQVEKKIMDVPQFLTLRREQKYIIGFDRFFSYGDYAIAQFRYQNHFYWLLIDRRSAEVFVVQPHFPWIEEYKISYRPTYVNDKGEIAFLVSPYEILDYYYSSNKKGLYPSLDKLVENNLQAEDNLLVMWVPFKKLLESIK